MQKNTEPIFSEYKSHRASDDIADQIKNAILDGKFRNENRLPSERSLASQFNVSRLTVREALRLLEAKGLIYIKKGATGGAFFQSESPEQIASIVIDRLQLDGITIDHITETRVVLERGIVRCAAENADENDIKVLGENLEKLKEVKKRGKISVEQSKRFVLIILEFHKLLAEASHIPPLIMFNQTINAWGERKIRHWYPTKNEIIMRYETFKKIFECIKTHNVTKGQKIMEQHIRKTSPLFDKL